MLDDSDIRALPLCACGAHFRYNYYRLAINPKFEAAVETTEHRYGPILVNTATGLESIDC